MRRLIAYANALLLGMILGMIFVAIVYAPEADRHATVRNGSRLLQLVVHQRDLRLAR